MALQVRLSLITGDNEMGFVTLDLSGNTQFSPVEGWVQESRIIDSSFFEEGLNPGSRFGINMLSRNLLDEKNRYMRPLYCRLSYDLLCNYLSKCFFFSHHFIFDFGPVLRKSSSIMSL